MRGTKGDFTADERVRALLYFFGWQGGTIHQLADATGLCVQQILHDPLSEKCTDAFSGVRTCDRDWRRNKLAPSQKGNWDDWSSVIKGFWATGPLDNA